MRRAIGLLVLSALALQPVGMLAVREGEPPRSGAAGSGGRYRNGPSRPERPIRVDVNVVLVTVTVVDSMNRTISGLEKEQFRVFEDKEEQRIAYFSGEDVPISVGILFDASGSMADKINKCRMAVRQFLETANPWDEFFVLDFNDHPRLVSGFTSQFEGIQAALNFTVARGSTALLDAVYLALHQMRRARHPKKALLILSDGGDNHSRYTASEIRSVAREADVQIYAIGVFEPLGSRGRTLEELSGPSLLSELAEVTGGRHLPVEDPNELPDIAGKISTELRNQYVLGYRPTNAARDGRWRKIKVKLIAPRGLSNPQAYARAGYYAPSH